MAWQVKVLPSLMAEFKSQGQYGRRNPIPCKSSSDHHTRAPRHKHAPPSHACPCHTYAVTHVHPGHVRAPVTCLPLHMCTPYPITRILPSYTYPVARTPITAYPLTQYPITCIPHHAHTPSHVYPATHIPPSHVYPVTHVPPSYTYPHHTCYPNTINIKK